MTVHIEDLTAHGQYTYRAVARDGDLAGYAELKEEFFIGEGCYVLTTFVERGSTRGLMGKRQREQGQRLCVAARAAMVEALRSAGWTSEVVTKWDEDYEVWKK